MKACFGSTLTSACSHRIKFFSHPGYLELKADVYKRCVLIADLGTSHQPDQIKAEILSRIKSIKELAGLKPVIRIYTPEDPENKALRMDAHNQMVGALQQVLNEHFAAGRGEDDDLMITPYAMCNLIVTVQLTIASQTGSTGVRKE
jgi:hypothetical protein